MFCSSPALWSILLKGKKGKVRKESSLQTPWSTVFCKKLSHHWFAADLPWCHSKVFLDDSRGQGFPRSIVLEISVAESSVGPELLANGEIKALCNFEVCGDGKNACDRVSRPSFRRNLTRSMLSVCQFLLQICIVTRLQDSQPVPMAELCGQVSTRLVFRDIWWC